MGRFRREAQGHDVLAELRPVGWKDAIGEERKELLAQVEPAEVGELQEWEQSLPSGFPGSGDINKLVEFQVKAENEPADRVDRPGLGASPGDEQDGVS